MRSSENRYQNQPWHIKLWRRRWYLMIPYLSLNMWGKVKGNFKLCWKISIGLAQSKMEWWYSLEEVKERMEKRFKSFKS